LKFRIFILVSVLFALSACDSGSDGGPPDESMLDCEPGLDPSLIQGCWETSCVQDGSTYLTSVYSFDKTGYLYYETRNYRTTDCSDTAFSYSPIFGGVPSDISYVLGDRYTDSSGVEVDSLRMIQEVEENPVMDFDFETVYKVLDGNQLCTTDSLRLETQRYYIGPGFDDIDYNKCIKRVE
jgi:hypothetical protein